MENINELGNTPAAVQTEMYNIAHKRFRTPTPPGGTYVSAECTVGTLRGDLVVYVRKGRGSSTTQQWKLANKVISKARAFEILTETFAAVPVEVPVEVLVDAEFETAQWEMYNEQQNDTNASETPAREERIYSNLFPNGLFNGLDK